MNEVIIVILMIISSISSFICGYLYRNIKKSQKTIDLLNRMKNQVPVYSQERNLGRLDVIDEIKNL